MCGKSKTIVESLESTVYKAFFNVHLFLTMSPEWGLKWIVFILMLRA